MNWSQSSLLFSSVLSLVGFEVAAADRAAREEPFLRRGPGAGRDAEATVGEDFEAVLVMGAEHDAGEAVGGEEAAVLVVEDWERCVIASGCERGSKRVVV